MDLKLALENIKKIKPKFALEEIQCIRDNKEEAIPVLLDYVKEVIVNIDGLPDNYDAHSYAMFLLAEFKVKSAFEYLIKYIELSTEDTDWLLGDVLTEDFGAILASVATENDIDRIKTVIENNELDEFQRSAALTALIAMYVEGAYLQQDLFDYIGLLLEKCKNEIYFNTLVACDCIDIYASEYFEYIEKLFQNDLMDEGMMDIDDFYTETASGSLENSLSALKCNMNKTVIADTVKSMSWWACFNEQPAISNKIGRNEPCPCGSGKKYKKCCLQ